MALIQPEVISNMEKNLDKYARRYNKNRREVAFDVGQKVMIFKDLRKKDGYIKFQHKWFGPYEVTEHKSTLNFKVKPINPMTQRKIEDAVHVSKMKPFYEEQEFDTEFPTTFQIPALTSNDEDKTNSGNNDG